ncbi:MAG: DUF1461 domain-containing protein [Eggerthellaceae bacterium]|nr:DUF1461 domain-containing protein [Eggerthellaceae bacterium]
MARGRTADIKAKVLQGLLKTVTAVCLAAALVGSGLFMCCAPFSTTALSNLFSNWQGSPFTHDELVKAAQATLDYTVGSNDRAKLFPVIYDINMSAKANGRATNAGAPDLPDGGMPATDELAARFSLAGESYVLTNDALSHLDDVYRVISTARIVLIVLAVVGLAGLVVVGITRGRRHVGIVVIVASIVVLALFIALAGWIIVDFDGFFTALHSLFFTAGTWEFSADSLLIRMYPENFWVGMGAIWLATSILACVVGIILGRLIKGRKRAL